VGEGTGAQSAFKIGITGHALSAPATEIVSQEIRRRLDLLTLEFDLLAGVSCLARGADTIFAEAILDRGVPLEIIIPSADYRGTIVHPDHAPAFDHAVARAAKVDTLLAPEPGPKAYAAANEAMLDRVGRLLAVWDGLTNTNEGGTWSAVASARSRGIPVDIIWPEGAERLA
jgi:hypothetical protein